MHCFACDRMASCVARSQLHQDTSPELAFIPSTNTIHTHARKHPPMLLVPCRVGPMGVSFERCFCTLASRGFGHLTPSHHIGTSLLRPLSPCLPWLCSSNLLRFSRSCSAKSTKHPNLFRSDPCCSDSMFRVASYRRVRVVDSARLIKCLLTF